MNPLKKARLDKDWTVAKLSEMSGIAGSTISDIENGIKKARALTLNRLARALDVQVETLLTLETDHKRIKNRIAA